MSRATRTYSAVLKLNEETLQRLIHSADGRAWALKMLVVVGLIAGLGHWFGLPVAFQQKSLAQQIDQIGTLAANGLESVVTPVAEFLRNADPQRALNDVSATLRDRSANAVAPVKAAVAGAVEPLPTADELLVRKSVTADEIESVVRRARVSADQLGKLVEKADIPRAQLDRIIAETGVTPEDAAAIRTRAENGLGAATQELQPLLDGLHMTAAEFKALLDRAGLKASQVVQVLKSLSITPEQLGAEAARLSATPDQVQAFFDTLNATAATTDPVLGVRGSAAVRVIGRWLATPFQILASWALFAFVLLAVGRLIGGRATLPEHVSAVALAAAPLVLTLGLYIPSMTVVTTIPFDFALHLVGKMFALVGYAWAALLLLRTLSLAHRFTAWRSAGAIALTSLAFTVIPLAGALLTGYLLVRP